MPKIQVPPESLIQVAEKFRIESLQMEWRISSLDHQMNTMLMKPKDLLSPRVKYEVRKGNDGLKHDSSGDGGERRRRLRGLVRLVKLYQQTVLLLVQK
ncbi:hypothetical protein XI25_07720 [Paenibacillus sp. DMB20]|nr:hypothetical protein XI25_07720 [Paenibacillus sp. DMB20]